MLCEAEEGFEENFECFSIVWDEEADSFGRTGGEDECSNDCCNWMETKFTHPEWEFSIRRCFVWSLRERKKSVGLRRTSDVCWNRANQPIEAARRLLTKSAETSTARRALIGALRFHWKWASSSLCLLLFLLFLFLVWVFVLCFVSCVKRPFNIFKIKWIRLFVAFVKPGKNHPRSLFVPSIGRCCRRLSQVFWKLWNFLGKNHSFVRQLQQRKKKRKKES